MKKSAPLSTILFAGDDPVFADLVQRLKTQGLDAEHACEGNQALTLALRMNPSLVVIDVTLREISAPRFAQILRGNRQGSDLPIVFVGEVGDEVEGFVRHRDSFFARPLNPDQLLFFVEKHFRRLARAQQLLRQKHEVEGSLDHLGIADLLQLFGLNGKSGTLILLRGAEQGTILLQDGEVINAHLGRVDGEKAFYRLLRWQSGTFHFSPGRAVGPVKITTPLSRLVMEGLRLSDEVAALGDALPSLHSRMQLSIPRERLPQGLRSATREVLAKLEDYPRVSDLLDQCPYDDVQVLQVLQVLREKGVISEKRDEGGEEVSPLLSVTEILGVQQELCAGAAHGVSLSAVVMILSPAAADLNKFLPALHLLREFIPSPHPRSKAQLPDEVGRLQLSDAFSLRLIVVPATAEFAPLWPLYLRQLFAVISLAPAGTFPLAEKSLSATDRGWLYLDRVARRALMDKGREGWGELLRRLLPFQTRNSITTEVP